ncbi:MAG: hypothetical protein AB1411_16555 [Nitrospirota bacterium]
MNPSTVAIGGQFQAMRDHKDVIVGTWWDVGMMQLRFDGHGRMGVRFDTPDLAMKLAETLVVTGKES